MPPTWLNDTPFRRKDCRESIYAFGSRLALQFRIDESLYFMTRFCLFSQKTPRGFCSMAKPVYQPPFDSVAPTSPYSASPRRTLDLSYPTLPVIVQVQIRISHLEL